MMTHHIPQAIVGYEQDQVMVTPTGKPGVNPSQDVSVPINWAYNHHYMAWMTGAHSEIRKVLYCNCSNSMASTRPLCFLLSREHPTPSSKRVGAPHQYLFEVGSKLPLPLYADVRTFR